MEKQSGDMAFFMGLVAGAIAGGAVAALLMPRSGPEAREQIVERGLELKGQAGDVVERAQRIASETLAKVQVAAQDLLGPAASTGADGSEQRGS